MMLDRDISSACALVIDGNPTSRSILCAQLRDMGVGTVVQAPRLSDGRVKIETRTFDIVVCEQVFPGHDQSGQDLLDDLRRCGLLPHSTVFVMVTGESRYQHVAEAAESALDCYLLKPYSATTLAERLRQARHRKRELADVFTAIEKDQFEQAARLCLDRFTARGDYWLYAARLGAELLLRIGQHETAGKLYGAIIEAKAVPWAKLGVARAQADGGRLETARRTLLELTSADPEYADAWDVMGRVQVEQGQFDDALETYRKAAAITPSSIPRLQKQGMLAYYQGQTEEADRMLDRAALLGISSKMFDHQSLVVLAFARFQSKDSKGLQRCRENLAFAAERDPESTRLARFVQVASALEHLLAKRLSTGLALVQNLIAQASDPELDVEAGCNLLSLLAELAAFELQLDDMETCVQRIGIRFSSSRSITELMIRAASRHPPFGELVNQSHAKVLSLSEQAMSHALEGRPETAVRKLLEHAESTLNAKLADTARLTLQRYRSAIDDAESLETRIAALRERYALSWAAPRLGQGGRASGGVALRDGSPAAQTMARAGQATEPAAAGATLLRTDSPDPAAATAA